MSDSPSDDLSGQIIAIQDLSYIVCLTLYSPNDGNSYVKVIQTNGRTYLVTMVYRKRLPHFKFMQILNKNSFSLLRNLYPNGDS